LKRITYISRLNAPLSEREVQEIGAISSRNNRELQITGVLISFSGLFFQIIEGEDSAVDWLYAKIARDSRHTDLLCLRAEIDVKERLFPNWSMNVINLDQNTDLLIQPVKMFLQAIADSHRIIERYTQPAVMRILTQGANPLEVPVRKVEKIVLFADIVAYSAIAEHLPVEAAALMINRYLDTCSERISAMGGEVTKFIGDCVMAYFDPGQADGALQACLEILGDLKVLRRSAAQGSPLRLLHCGFGLAQGMVIEGNLGSTIKTDFTVIGDAVNTAARLEALTRKVQKAIVVSEGVRSSAGAQWNFAPLGIQELKGKNEAAEAFYPDLPLVHEFETADSILRAARTLG